MCFNITDSNKTWITCTLMIYTVITTVQHVLWRVLLSTVKSLSNMFCVFSYLSEGCLIRTLVYSVMLLIFVYILMLFCPLCTLMYTTTLMYGITLMYTTTLIYTITLMYTTTLVITVTEVVLAVLDTSVFCPLDLCPCWCCLTSVVWLAVYLLYLPSFHL